MACFQIEKMCCNIEQQMFSVYEKQSTLMQSKLAEVFATLDRIAILDAELQQFKHALGSLYQDVS